MPRLQAQSTEQQAQSAAQIAQIAQLREQTAQIEARLQAQTAELQNEAGGTKSLWGCCLQRRGKKTADEPVSHMDNPMW